MKIAFIDHSYRQKTASSKFLVELLSENAELELVTDDSWKTGVDPDLSKIDDSYTAVVFFQLISKRSVEQVRSRNIIFVPMYDGLSRSSVSFWKSLYEHHVRVLNFSSTLNYFCSKLGMQCKQVRYYPAPADTFKPVKELRVFFWQRGNSVDLDLVLSLTGKNISSLHHHWALDPFQKHRMPSLRQLSNIKYKRSSWFKNQADYLALLQECSIFVAPRLEEGIGMSFLEAMSLGKAVIAADCPTMNEYITHNKNGYLFNPFLPKRIDFSNLDKITLTSYETVQRGYKEWLAKRESILEWILTSNEQKKSTLFGACVDFPGIEALAAFSLLSEHQSGDRSEKEELQRPPVGTILTQMRWFLKFVLSVRGLTLDDLLRFRVWRRLLAWPFKKIFQSSLGKIPTKK
jgi:hypothetical protein